MCICTDEVMNLIIYVGEKRKCVSERVSMHEGWGSRGKWERGEPKDEHCVRENIPLKKGKKGKNRKTEYMLSLLTASIVLEM